MFFSLSNESANNEMRKKRRTNSISKTKSFVFFSRNLSRVWLRFWCLYTIHSNKLESVAWKWMKLLLRSTRWGQSKTASLRKFYCWFFSVFVCMKFWLDVFFSLHRFIFLTNQSWVYSLLLLLLCLLVYAVARITFSKVNQWIRRTKVLHFCFSRSITLILIERGGKQKRRWRNNGKRKWICSLLCCLEKCKPPAESDKKWCRNEFRFNSTQHKKFIQKKSCLKS